MNEYKSVENYFWGNIYKIKDEFRDGDKLKNTEDGLWFIGSDDNHGIKYTPHLNSIKDKDFEIKYWEFKVGKGTYQRKKRKIQKSIILHWKEK